MEAAYLHLKKEPVIKKVPVTYAKSGTIYSKGSVIVSMITPGHDHEYLQCPQCDFENQQMLELHRQQEKMWWEEWYKEQQTIGQNQMQFLNNPAYHQLNEVVDLTDDNNLQDSTTKTHQIAAIHLTDQEQINKYNKSVWYEHQLQMQLKNRQEEEHKENFSISNVIHGVNRKRTFPVADEPPAKRFHSDKKHSIFHSVFDLAQSSNHS